ncbi:MAG: DEAD/DEAH box helicase [Holophagales bacterium]|nr:DEAD/DEAH box helicase [Holophagales bacterium]
MNNLTFAALGCDAPYLAALDSRGFTTPTPVQRECFEPGLRGQDLLVQSRTGSGKTLAFGLPLMHRLSEHRYPQAIILTPTRELAQQVAHELRSVNRNLEIAQLVGGMSYTPQLRALSEGARVIVGTPGRVMDHMERETLDLSNIRMVVLDECDEMLNMGFIEDVEHILSDVPPQPQTYLFSATLPAPIASLAKRFLNNPCRIELTESGGAAQHADICHTACLIAEHFHVKALTNLLLHDEPSSALIFTKMKQQTEEVAEALRNAGLAADYLHGDLNQGARNRILSSFKAGRLRYLVATDVAARGIDVGGLPLVVNMGIPTQFENYIHRTGRTGRAGAKGTSMSLVGYKESRILLAWARRGGLKLEWRAVPTPDEIRKSRSNRLSDRVGLQESPIFEELARNLLKTRSAESLVAALLSLIEDEAHLGFDIPEAPEIKRVKFPNASATSKRHDSGRTSERSGGKFERSDKSRRSAERSSDQFSRDKKSKWPERRPKQDAPKSAAPKEYFSSAKTSKSASASKKKDSPKASKTSRPTSSPAGKKRKK